MIFCSVVFDLFEGVVVESEDLVTALTSNDNFACFWRLEQWFRHTHFLLVLSHWLHGSRVLLLLAALFLVGNGLIFGNAQACLSIFDNRLLNHISAQMLLLFICMSSFKCLGRNFFGLDFWQGSNIVGINKFDCLAFIGSSFQQELICFLFNNNCLNLNILDMQFVLEFWHYLLVVSLKVQHFLVFCISNFEHGILLLFDLLL